MIYENVQDLVGNTPLVKIGQHNGAVILAKLEGHNPTGSLKDRTASAIVREYVKSGKKGHTLIDASSGSFACSLAYFGRLAGLNVSVVVNSKISDDNLAFLRTQGATIIKYGTVTGESRQHCVDLVSEDPEKWYFTDQLTNPLAPSVHELTTAAEIMKDCPTASAIVGSKGSGATLCGIARHFQPRRPEVKIFGSVGFPDDTKKIAGTYVEGVDFVTPFIAELQEAANYIGDVPITHAGAIERCRALPILVGPQGGGVIEAALIAIETHEIEGYVVCVAGDTILKNSSRF